MALLKQLIVTVAVLVVAVGLWIRFDAAPGQYILAAGWDLPPEVTSLVAWLSPPPEENTAASGQGGAGGRGGSGRDRAALVVADAVTTSITRNRLKGIGSGEAIRSAEVYADATGIVSEVGFEPGSEVAAGDVLVTLESDAEALALDRARIAAAAAEEKLVRFQRLQEARTISTVEVADVQRELDNARLDVRAAEIALADRRVVAPIGGRVGIASIDSGDLVNNQTLIATIDDRSKLKVIFYVPEVFVPELSIGQKVEAVSTARPGDVYQGEISAIDSRLDEASRTLMVEATIDNPEDELRPGMSFSMSMNFEGEEFLSVDPLAVQWERAGPFVWKIVDDTVEKASIRIIERNVDRVLVASEEIAEGDRVVTEGVQSVREGGKVRVLETKPAQDDETDEVPTALNEPTSTSGVHLTTPAGAAVLRPGDRSGL